MVQSLTRAYMAAHPEIDLVLPRTMNLETREHLLAHGSRVTALGPYGNTSWLTRSQDKDLPATRFAGKSRKKPMSTKEESESSDDSPEPPKTTADGGYIASDHDSDSSGELGSKSSRHSSNVEEDEEVNGDESQTLAQETGSKPPVVDASQAPLSDVLQIPNFGVPVNNSDDV
jgi:hypothetical protein